MIVCADAMRGLETARAKVIATGAAAYDYIFIDPPYARPLKTMRACSKSRRRAHFLAEGGIVIVEHRKTFDLPESFGTLKRVRLLRQRRCVR